MLTMPYLGVVFLLPGCVVVKREKVSRLFFSKNLISLLLVASFHQLKSTRNRVIAGRFHVHRPSVST